VRKKSSKKRFYSIAVGEKQVKGLGEDLRRLRSKNRRRCPRLAGFGEKTEARWSRKDDEMGKNMPRFGEMGKKKNHNSCVEKERARRRKIEVRENPDQVGYQAKTEDVLLSVRSGGNLPGRGTWKNTDSGGKKKTRTVTSEDQLGKSDREGGEDGGIS